MSYARCPPLPYLNRATDFCLEICAAGPARDTPTSNLELRTPSLELRSDRPGVCVACLWEAFLSIPSKSEHQLRSPSGKKGEACPQAGRNR